MNRFLLVQILTVIRIPLAVAFAILLPLAMDGRLSLWVCLALLWIQECSDLLDGALARRLGVVSRLGQLLDPFADSVSRLIVFWALAQTGLTLASLPLVMALRDVTVAYSRLLVADHGGSVSARVSGKIKAWVQGLGALFLTGAPLLSWSADLGAEPASIAMPSLVLSWIIFLVTAASAAEYLLAAISGNKNDSTALP